MGLERFFNQRFTIERITRSANGKGGFAQKYSAVASDIHGSIRPISAQERTLGDQESAKVSHVAYLHGGTDVRRDDQLRTAADNTYLVVDVRDPAGLGRHYEIDCYQVQRGR